MKMDHGNMPGMKMPADKPMDHSGMPGMKMPANGAMDHSSMPGMKMPADRSQDHSNMPGMKMPADSAMDHANMPGMKMPADGASEHSSMPGMKMPADGSMDHSATPGMSPNGGADMATMNSMDVPHSAPPPPPKDRAADKFFAPDAMAVSNAQLRREHGGELVSMAMMNLGEYQVRNGKDGFRWEGQAWYGGDLDRFVLKTEGEGSVGEGVDAAELQGLYSRAVGVYTDAQFGIRQDFEPHSRTYVTAGIQSLLPYWFDVSGAIFLSTKGEFLGRLEGTYDLLLTNRLIVQPRAELNFAAQNTLETRTGSGLSNAELGLRVRYEVTREFAPYIGISWDRKVGQTANYTRASGQDIEATSFVFGVRAFF
jgi:copper resistance protein B